ncbi:hypothetical protein SAMN06265222_101985 [Neorhodopirellula lusitana]|uniref:Uncharacterized protein n=1 Tax=Neorhodopirellula lusitana TaxID=445327 RepID=A0ABY1PSQ5_9BACT|nr:hypothetical protein SAMN06265222_101985 [Neorhodopirellula lusitana]
MIYEALWCHLREPMKDSLDKVDLLEENKKRHVFV